MNQYMLKHLTQNRTSDRFRGFSYRKILVDSRNKRGEINKAIAWDIYYQDVRLTTLDTLKEVKYYIDTKTTRL
jgi:hypothetical protein